MWKVIQLMDQRCASQWSDFNGAQRDKAIGVSHWPQTWCIRAVSPHLAHVLPCSEVSLETRRC